MNHEEDTMAVTFKEMLEMSVEVYLIDGIRAAYLDLRVDRNTVPENVHTYEIRDTTDDGGWYIGNVEDFVLVNHAGTMFTAKPLKMRHPDWGLGVYMDMSDDDEPWSSVDGPATALKEFLESEGIDLDKEG